MKRILPLFALLALPAVADEPAAAGPAPVAPAPAAPAPAAAEAAPVAAPAGEAVPERPKVRPGPMPHGRNMTPEMRAYVDRLETIRLARDEQARTALQASKEIEARKEALAAENEDVKTLVGKIAEFRESLAAAEKELAALYSADEALAALEAKKADAEKARDEKQREMNASVAAAMDERAARFNAPRPAPRPAPRAPAPRPAAAAPSSEPTPAPAAE